MTEPPPQPSTRRELVRTLVINAAAPYAVYMLCKPHFGGLVALALSAVPPAVESLVSVVRRRRLDVVGALVLGGIAASLVLIALGGSERILLLRESLITSLVGIALAASVAARRPILYYLARQMQAAGNPAEAARMDARWDAEPGFRRSMRLLSLVWGIGLVIEMVVRTIMVFDMEISHFLLISPFVQYGMTGLLVLWTVAYGRRRIAPDA